MSQADVLYSLASVMSEQDRMVSSGKPAAEPAVEEKKKIQRSKNACTTCHVKDFFQIKFRLNNFQFNEVDFNHFKFTS